LLGVDKELLLDLQVVLEYFRGCHHDSPQRLIERASGYGVLGDAWGVPYGLYLHQFLGIPKADGPIDADRYKLPLPIIKLKHQDLRWMGVN